MTRAIVHMIRSGRRPMVAALFAGLFALGACTPTTTPTSSAGPLVGETTATPEVAAQLMQTVCGASNPGNAARANGFQAPSALGTYFHSQFSLSINPSGSGCTLVYSSTASQSTVEAALRSVPATLYRVSPDITNPPNTLYAARFGG